MKDGEPLKGYDYHPPKKVPSVSALKATYFSYHPEYTKEEWRGLVFQERILLGYWEWVRSQLLGEEE